MSHEIDLKHILKGKNSVMISAHVSPDADAFCSTLLLARIIKLNFPDIKVTPILEERPAQGFTYLTDYKKVIFGDIPKAIKKHSPELFIIIDCNNFDRISRQDAQQIKQFVQERNIETLIIDHHEEVGRYQSNHFFNRMSPAATQDVYYIAKQNNLKLPDSYQDTLMLGILSDTGRFKYKNRYPEETFSLAGKLVAEGVDIEHLSYLSDMKYSEESIHIIGNLAQNTTKENGYSISFVDDDFAKRLLKQRLNQNILKSICAHFIDTYSRNIGSNKWGAVIYPELAKKGSYSVSFRALNGAKDVSLIANKLGGGGHKPAAGAKFEAENIEQALIMIKAAIKD